jgi:hypothetical protein
MTLAGYTEDALIEQLAIELLKGRREKEILRKNF